MLNTPVLLITFNRVDHVRNALSEIRKIQPRELYIAQDGPRVDRSDDIPKIQAVRDVIREMVDWPCNLHTHYSSTNLGCGPGPYAAMSWFFSEVEYGIILEDDIIPHPLFWNYMEELLIKYKDDYRVGMVCAHNLQRRYCGSKSYYFTYAMEGTLGWGTWKRVWKDFQFTIPFNADKLSQSLRQNYRFQQPMIKQYCNLYHKWLSTDRHDCWDFQWDYYLLENGYLNARANSCLTSHEGDDGDATHSGYTNPNYKMSVTIPLFTSITDPKKVQIHWKECLRAYWRSIKLVLKQAK
jgi:hypothetical protein